MVRWRDRFSRTAQNFVLGAGPVESTVDCFLRSFIHRLRRLLLFLREALNEIPGRFFLRLAGTTVMWIANKLLSEYNSNPKVKKMMDGIEWHIAPVVNADGYVITHTKDRLRRINANQVDLNRNFGFLWKKKSCSGPAAEECPGPKAFSEPESRAVRDHVQKYKSRVKSFLDIHSYSQVRSQRFEKSPFQNRGPRGFFLDSDGDSSIRRWKNKGKKYCTDQEDGSDDGGCDQEGQRSQVYLRQLCAAHVSYLWSVRRLGTLERNSVDLWV
jgi:hypothetical protein